MLEIGEITKWFEKKGGQILEKPSEVFPLLAEIADPPERLYVLGDMQCLKLPSIAIVGTRKPTVYGVRASLNFSKGLSVLGLTIISGLARGIDSFAHRGALAGNGKTVAILGHGFGRIYPPENQNLAEQILEAGGCLISEYAPGMPPLAHHFPARNRLISGLSLGTLVIEAAEKSGSLITARTALEQNREVFVVPSHYDEASFSGGHKLLQQGAKLVLNVGDVLSEIEVFLRPTVLKGEPNKTSTEFKLLQEQLSPFEGGLSLEQLRSNSGDNAPQLMRELISATLRGQVVETRPQHFIWVEG